MSALAIKESSARVVTVDGAVKRAGLLPGRWADHPDAGGCLGQGHYGGRQSPPRRGVPDHRRGSARRRLSTCTAIRRGQTPDPQIYPGDIVVVDGSAIKALQKQILQTSADPFDLPSVLDDESDFRRTTDLNNNLAVPNEGPWPLGRYAPSPHGPAAGQRIYSAANILDFATLLRIIHHWRWLILGAVALGPGGGGDVDLADHAGLSRLGRRSRPIRRRSRSPTNSRASDRRACNSYDFVATQVGLLSSSRSVAERTAQDLNLANNPEFVPQDRDAADALWLAAGKVAGGLNVIAPEEGPADQVQLRFDLAAAGRAGRQRDRRQLHQLRAPAALRSVGLRPQFPRAADRQDPRRP